MPAMFGRPATVWPCDPCVARQEVLERQEAAKRAQHDFEVRLRNIPTDLRRFTFADSPAPEAAITAAQMWARGEIQQLLLCGPVGTGKTGLAASAVRERCERGATTWVSVPRMLANLTASFGDEDRAEALSAMTGHGAIVLDDLDKMRAGPTAAASIFAAIDGRIQSGAQILVTANKTPAQIASTIGDEFGMAIGDRLRAFTAIEVGGPSQRKAQRIGDTA
jgi:DNA replication protein DnaC